jgi:hypothetical protein
MAHEGAAERDASNTFVADNYAVLKEHRVFSALIPDDLAAGKIRPCRTFWESSRTT